MKLATAFVIVVLGTCYIAYADEPTTVVANEAITVAKNFWNVFVQADMALLEEQYADEIILKAGSEFLKKQWGINESDDRTKDKTVSREDLMKAYSVMFAKIGEKKWKKVFGSIAEENITAKTLENKHVILIIKIGKGDDQFEFELAFNEDKAKWQVVAEQTDY